MTSGVRPYTACQPAGSALFHFHESWNGRDMTLCGRDAEGWTMGRGDGRLCRVCHRIAVARLRPSAMSEKAAEAGRRLMDSLIEHEDARVWEIAGNSGIHHVVILPGLSMCSCLAGKTHPLDLCRHQAAAFMLMAEEDARETSAARGAA